MTHLRKYLRSKIYISGCPQTDLLKEKKWGFAEITKYFHNH